MTEKLFCTLMGHKWSNWTSESNSCTQSRKCNRQNCNAQDTRFIPHEWNDWFYYEDDSCKQIRKCKHCPESENKILHQWTDYQYEKDHYCPTISQINSIGYKHGSLGLCQQNS